MTIEFTLPFVHGLQRPRTGNGFVYDTARNRADKKAVADAYREACYHKPFKAERNQPVRIYIKAARSLPKTTQKCVLFEHDTHKPDIDNIEKLVLDGLNGVAYEDDAQVIELKATKLPRSRRKDTTYVTVDFGAANLKESTWQN